MAIYGEVTVRDISSTPEIVGVEYDVTCYPITSQSISLLARYYSRNILRGWVGTRLAPRKKHKFLIVV